MSFLRAYAALDAGDPAATSAARVALTRAWLLERPHALFAELRQDQPIFTTPGFVLLTRHAEVREVLSRDDVFSATPYAAALQPLFGAFVLASDDGPIHERDAAVLRLTIRRADLEDIAAAAEQAAGVAVAAGRVDDRLDAVRDLARPVVADFIARYLGVAGPEPEMLLRWARTLTRAAFCNDDEELALVDAAREAAAELAGYIDVTLASRRTQMLVGGPPGVDAIGRLLALQLAESARLDDRRVRELLIGVIASAAEPTIAATAHTIAELARRPEVQAQAIAALAADDPAPLAAIVDEALRLAPPLWTPVRLCTRSFTLAKGTANETVLRRGVRVLASTHAAGLDPAEVDAPELFRPGRRAHLPLGFGAGLHACLGRHVAPILVRAAVTALLRVGPVRLVGDGLLREGPFPAALALEFGS
jgi:cytochrome P450